MGLPRSRELCRLGRPLRREVCQSMLSQSRLSRRPGCSRHTQGKVLPASDAVPGTLLNLILTHTNKPG